MCLSSELSGLLSLWALVVVCAEGQLIEFSEATGEWTVATFSADMATDSSSAVLFCSALLCRNQMCDSGFSARVEHQAGRGASEFENHALAASLAGH